MSAVRTRMQTRQQKAKGNGEPDPVSENNNKGVLMPLLVMFLGGCVFGMALQKGRVFEPGNIYKQMTFEKFIMFKMFFMAMIGSLLSLTFLSIFQANKFQKAVDAYSSCLCGKTIWSWIIGGTTLGAGMSIAGSCPGNVYIQFGGGLDYAWYTLLGSLCATVFYSFLFSIQFPVVYNNKKNNQTNKTSLLHQMLGKPYYQIALPFATLLFVMVCGLEYMVPWQTEIEKNHNDINKINVFALFAWPPMVSGLLVGLLQIPTVFMVDDTIGGSSSFMTIVANILPANQTSSFGIYLSKFKTGLGNYWQVVYVLGAAIGSGASATSSGSFGEADSIESFGPARNFIGGFLMLMGARIAGGCTSGHGISGMGIMNITSAITVCFMFVGGIGTAMLLKYY